MPADLDLHARTAGSWDAATIVDTLTPVLERTPLAWWLHPQAERTPSVRAYLRLLAAQPDQVLLRLIEDDGRILAAAAWTRCTTQDRLAAELTTPGHDTTGATRTTAAIRARAAHLHTLISRAHPDSDHHHLLLIAVRAGRHRHGIGTQLLTDDLDPPSPTLPTGVVRWALLPATLTPLAARAGYRIAGPPIRLTEQLSLQPHHHGAHAAPT